MTIRTCTRSDDAVIQQAHIYSLEGANKRDLAFLRRHLCARSGLQCFFRGEEHLPWEEENTDDLMALSSRYAEKDLLTRWISDVLIHWLHPLFFRRFKVCLRSPD